MRLGAGTSIAACMLLHGAASAQTLPLVDSKSFYEAFLDAPPTGGEMRGGPARIVGAVIVGLRFGGVVNAFDPSNIRVQLGDDTRGPSKILCVRTLSRDGRYFARARYKLDVVNATAPVLEFRTNFLSQLKGYTSKDVAILAVGAQNCDDPKGSQQFVIEHGIPAGATQIIVQLRAGDSRVRAQLGQNNAAASPAVLCERLTDGPTVAFSSECALALPNPMKAGKYQLSIGETGATGEVSVKTTTIVLAPP